MEALAVLALVIVATVLLVTERLRADVVALVVLGALILMRIVSPTDALSGFSNQATVTVACMFLISAGLQASGVVRFLGDRLLTHGPSSTVALLVLTTLIIAPLSAFINNTAVVAIFLPIMLRAAQGNHISPSRLMMPLSFVAMMGGTCTLIGTSTNILVSSLAEQHGMRPFKMFEFSILGLILLVTGATYLLLFGRRFIPERIEAESPTQGFIVNLYLSEVVVLEDSPLIGQSLIEAKLGEKYELEVVGHTRDKLMRPVPYGYTTLQADDILLVKASADAIVRLSDSSGLAAKAGRHPDMASLTSAASVLVEAVVTPNSSLDGRTLKGVNFRQRFGATTLAIRRGEDIREKIGRMRLKVGDELLIVAPRASLERLHQESDFVILQELEVPGLNPLRAATACLITAGVVTAATLPNGYPIAMAAVVGGILMVLTGCLPVRRMYQDIDWQVVFMLAGLIPLGVALETTGAAETAVHWMLAVAGGWGPHVVLGIFFLMASLMTGFMSNAATAVLLAPLAITTARMLEVDERPFLIALTFAASAAFWTPIGYQTNLLVYGPGGYRFADFIRAGGPLTLIIWIQGTLLIPHFFPFHP